jgi:hypothetical protein
MDVFIVQMLHQQIHVPQLSSRTAIPPAKANLLALVSKPAVVFITRQRSRSRGSHMWRPGHRSLGVGRQILIWERWGEGVEVALVAY